MRTCGCVRLVKSDLHIFMELGGAHVRSSVAVGTTSYSFFFYTTLYREREEEDLLFLLSPLIVLSCHAM